MSQTALQKHFPKLTRKRRFFVEEIVRTGNKAESYRAAFGTESKNPYHRAAELMQLPVMKEAIEARLREELESIGIDAHRVLKELAHIAFVDPAGIYATQAHVDRNEAAKVGDVLALRHMPEALRRAVVSVDVDTIAGPDGEFRGYTTKIRFLNKLDAIEKIGKYIKMWTEAGGGTTNNIFAAPGSNVQVNGVLVLPAVRD